MKKRTKKNLAAKENVPAALASLPESYLALIAEFPLSPIRNGTEYDRAAKIIHRLALLDEKLDAGAEAYLDVLETLTENYDREHVPISLRQDLDKAWSDREGAVDGDQVFAKIAEKSKDLKAQGR